MNFPTKTLGAGVVLSLKSVMSASHDLGLSSIQWRAIARVGQRPTLQRTSVRRRVEPGRTRNVCSWSDLVVIGSEVNELFEALRCQQSFVHAQQRLLHFHRVFLEVGQQDGYKYHHNSSRPHTRLNQGHMVMTWGTGDDEERKKNGPRLLKRWRTGKRGIKEEGNVVGWQYLVLYSALLACLDYCFYTHWCFFVFFCVCCPWQIKIHYSFIHSFIHSFKDEEQEMRRKRKKNESRLLKSMKKRQKINKRTKRKMTRVYEIQVCTPSMRPTILTDVVRFLRVQYVEFLFPVFECIRCKQINWFNTWHP